MEANQASVDAAAAALKTHEDALNLEGDPSIQVWHLLVSLHEYCAAKGIDFNERLLDVREELASGVFSSPAWEAAHRNWVELKR